MGLGWVSAREQLVRMQNEGPAETDEGNFSREFLDERKAIRPPSDFVCNHIPCEETVRDSSAEPSCVTFVSCRCGRRRTTGSPSPGRA